MALPTLQANYEALAEIRRDFDNMLKEEGYYPQVLHPGDVFVLDQVLGLDPRSIVFGSLTRKGYEALVFDSDGKRILNKRGTGALRVTREWDAQQKAQIRKWWDLLSPDARGLV